MTEQTEIEQPAQPSALTLAVQKVASELAGFDKITAGLEQLHREHPVDVAIDVTAADGMKQAIKSRAAWRDPRIAIEKVRKAAKAPVLDLGRDIDTFAANLTKQLQVGELHYDGMIQAELTRKAELKRQEEEREAARKEAIERRIGELFTGVPALAFGQPAATIEAALEHVTKQEIGAEYAEFAEVAKDAQQRAAEALRVMLAQQMHREREAEAARLQAEENARQAAKLAAERAEFEALQKKAREEQEARERADREARDKVEREQREERERIAAEQKKLDDAKRAAEEAKAAEERRKADEAAAAERKRLDEEAAKRREAEAQIAHVRGYIGQLKGNPSVKHAEALRELLAGFDPMGAIFAETALTEAATNAKLDTGALLSTLQTEYLARDQKADEEAKAEAKRQRAQRKLAAAQKAGPRLLAACKGCIEHMEHSTPQGKAAFEEAVAAIVEGEAA